jgi:hypothetical protein
MTMPCHHYHPSPLSPPFERPPLSLLSICYLNQRLLTICHLQGASPHNRVFVKPNGEPWGDSDSGGWKLYVSECTNSKAGVNKIRAALTVGPTRLSCCLRPHSRMSRALLTCLCLFFVCADSKQDDNGVLYESGQA